MRRPILFYDGRCPVCAREIAFYKRLDSRHEIDWRDIFQSTELLSEYDISFEQAMRLLHLIDEQGRMQTGAYAFVVVWRHMPGFRWIATVIERLRLLPLLDYGYRIVARRRYRARCNS